MELRSPDPACNPYLAIGLVLAAGLDGIENRMVLRRPCQQKPVHPLRGRGPSAGDPARLAGRGRGQVAEDSEFLHKLLPEELAKRYYAEELQRCAALKNAADPAEYERIHYFNAI